LAVIIFVSYFFDISSTHLNGHRSLLSNSFVKTPIIHLSEWQIISYKEKLDFAFPTLHQDVTAGADTGFFKQGVQ
jgi:hypothetical protein